MIAADTLEKALKIISEVELDIILLDLGLPDSSGLNGLQQICAKDPDIPVVILTGLDDSELSYGAIHQGAQDFLVKGEYNHKLLGKTIQHSIERNKLVIELKKTEEKLRVANENLQEEKGNLEAAQILTKKKNEELEQFAYVASHDLKAPITNLKSLTEIITKTNGVTTSAVPIFDKIIGSVNRMNDTITTLNEVLSLQSDLTLEKEPLIFSNTLAEVLAGIEHMTSNSKVKVITDFKAAESINYPKIHLHHIFQNLITNSIKYRANERTPTITIKTIKAGDSVYLTFEDNGCGIDLKKYEKKLFGLFQRFNTEIEGKGIGLFSTKTIIEKFGGTISVASELDKGTTFTINFG